METETDAEPEESDLPLDETLAILRECEDAIVTADGGKRYPLSHGFAEDLIRQEFRKEVAIFVGGEDGRKAFRRQRRRNARGGWLLLGKVRLTVSWEETINLLKHLDETTTRELIVEAAKEIFEGLRGTAEG